MKANVKLKVGYLPDFEQGILVDPSKAEDQAIAPPEVLFLYHTWSRLLSQYYIPNSISSTEFIEFLKIDKQWQPDFWPAAPEGYIQLVTALKLSEEHELKNVSLEVLPVTVRQAFQGWRNFYKQGEAINQFSPTYGFVREFLMVYPHYGRPFWQNLIFVAGSNYLLDNGTEDNEKLFPKEQLSSFLRVALYNAKQNKIE